MANARSVIGELIIACRLLTPNTRRRKLLCLGSLVLGGKRSPKLFRAVDPMPYCEISGVITPRRMSFGVAFLLSLVARRGCEKVDVRKVVGTLRVP
jgi:hypothetical protein